VSQTLPSLHEQLRVLEQLQELDLKIDRLKKSRDTLPAALGTLDTSLGKLRATAETRKTALGEFEKALRQTQAALELNRDRLTRSNSKLEAVQNSQEFQAAQKEIEQLRKLNASLEEQAKKSTTESEVIQKELSELQAQITQLEQERGSRMSELSGQATQTTAEIDVLMGERKKLVDSVERRILLQYDRIRVARAGLGVVPAIAGRCKGCNMMVPPQLYNEIQRGNQIHQCPSCHRILFAPSNPEPPAPANEPPANAAGT
jgi:uncharacterized protein